MEVAQRVRLVPESELPWASIVRKWHLDGVTTWKQEDFTRCAVEVRHGLPAPAWAVKAAVRHELGHVSVSEDVDSFETLRGYDVWQSEVEAWVRGIDNLDGHGVDGYTFGTFVLDCLNTYRRNLPITDEDWDTGRAALLLSLTDDRILRQRLMDYVPLEPDPPDPNDQSEGDGGCIGEGPLDDYHPQDFEPFEGPGMGEAEGPQPQPGSIDAGWNAPEVLLAIQQGVPPATIQRQRGLGGMSPMAEAVWTVAKGGEA